MTLIHEIQCSLYLSGSRLCWGSPCQHIKLQLRRRLGEYAFSLSGALSWNNLLNDLHKITDVNRVRCRLESFLYSRHYCIWTMLFCNRRTIKFYMYVCIRHDVRNNSYFSDRHKACLDKKSCHSQCAKLTVTCYWTDSNLYSAVGWEVAAGTTDRGSVVPAAANDWSPLRHNWAGVTVSVPDHTWENDGSWSSPSDVSPARLGSAAGSAHIPADSKMVLAISSAICSGVSVTNGWLAAVVDAVDADAAGTFSLLSFFFLDFERSEACKPLAIR